MNAAAVPPQEDAAETPTKWGVGPCRLPWGYPLILSPQAADTRRSTFRSSPPAWERHPMGREIYRSSSTALFSPNLWLTRYRGRCSRLTARWTLWDQFHHSITAKFARRALR